MTPIRSFEVLIECAASEYCASQLTRSTPPPTVNPNLILPKWDLALSLAVGKKVVGVELVVAKELVNTV